MIGRTHFLDFPVALVMGIENGSGIICSVGFVAQKLRPRMATKQASGMLIGPVLKNFDDTQTGTLQATISRTQRSDPWWQTVEFKLGLGGSTYLRSIKVR